MPLVVRQGGRLFNVDEQEVAGNLKANQWWQFGDQPAMVNVTAPDGQRYSMPFTLDSVKTALQRGFQLETADEAQHRWVQKNYGEDASDQLKAFGLSMLSGASLGLSDAFLRESGLTTADERRRYEEANPGLSVAGEITGAIVPAITSGGSTSGGTIARVLARTPAGVVARTSTGLRTALKASEASRLVKAAGRLAIGAGEGAAYSVGRGITEAVMADKPLLAEETLSYIGPHALFGAGMGAGVEAAAPALKWLFRAPRRLVGGKKATGYLKEFERLMSPQTVGPDVAPKEPGKMSSVWEVVLGNPAAAQEFAKKEGAMIGTEFPKVWEASTGVVTKGYNTLVKDGDYILEIWDQANKRALAKGAVPKGMEYGERAVHMTSRYWKDVLAELKELWKPLKAGAGPDASAAKRVMQIAERQLEQLGEIGIIGDDTARLVFSQADEYKKSLGKIIKRLRPQLSAGTELEERLFQQYKRLQKILEDTQAFGKMAEMQKPINEAYTRWLEDVPYREAGGILTPWRNVDFDKQLVAQPEEVKRILGGVGDSDRKLLYDHIMRDLKHRQALYRTVVEQTGHGTKQLGRVQKAIQDIRGHVDRMARAKKMLNLYDQATNQAMRDLTSPSTVGYTIGHMAIGGFAAGLGGAVLGGAMSPRGAVAGSAMRQRLARKLGKSVTVNGMLVEASQASRRVAEGKLRKLLTGKAWSRAAIPIATKVFDETRMQRVKKLKKSTDEVYKEVSEAVLKMANPDVMTDRLEDSLASLAEENPEVAQNIMIAAGRAVSYLASIMPAGLPASPVDMMQGRKPRVPTDSKERWLRSVQAVNDPTSVLDNPSAEGFAAVRAVYPRMYRTWLMMLAELTAEHKNELSYDTLASLSLMTGQPMAASLDPLFILQRQQAFAMQEGQQKGPREMDPSKIKSMSDANRSKMQAWEQNQNQAEQYG